MQKYTWSAMISNKKKIVFSNFLDDFHVKNKKKTILLQQFGPKLLKLGNGWGIVVMLLAREAWATHFA
jgi:hypothetical protein